MKDTKAKIGKLHISAAVIAAAAVITAAVVKFGESSDRTITSESTSEITLESNSASELSDGKIYISADHIPEGISFLDYCSADGTAMQYMIVKDSDGEVRGALNTCQICNGSPYAYFVPDGDSVICQNCRNEFPVDVIGITHGGCNPVPLEITEEDGNYIVDAGYLDSVSPAFANRKKGIEA